MAINSTYFVHIYGLRVKNNKIISICLDKLCGGRRSCC